MTRWVGHPRAIRCHSVHRQGPEAALRPLSVHSARRHRAPGRAQAGPGARHLLRKARDTLLALVQIGMIPCWSATSNVPRNTKPSCHSAFFLRDR